MDTATEQTAVTEIVDTATTLPAKTIPYTWNDTEWGICNGIGNNKLGKILMRIRKILRDREQNPDKYSIDFDA